MADITTYLAPEGYENDLAKELMLAGRRVLARHERLFMVEGGHKHELAWAQDTWLDCEVVDVVSIGDAVKALKKRGLRWGLVSQDFHRRARLIQSELPKVRTEPLEFLETIPPSKMGSWTLLEANKILLGKKSLSPLPGGQALFIEDKKAPSRAYLKLWELFTVYGIQPKKGDRCLDLGASPGGWSWVLANLGCEVIAVDRSPLEARLMKMKNVDFHQRNALTLKPGELGEVDWLFSDVICYPEDLYKLIENWLESSCRNFVCTLKFKAETDHATAKRFAAISGSRLRHLSCNKHELTWWLTREA